MTEAEENLKDKGYGKGSNYTTNLVANLMQSFADEQNKEFIDICQDFIDKVESGRARSVKTYNAMKKALNQQDNE